ncbi:MAG: hypothetical protein ACFFB3_21225 [Candidatus Hodarchaeota archaeon]
MYLSRNSQPLSEDREPEAGVEVHQLELRLSCTCGNVLWVPFPLAKIVASDNKKVNATCQCGEVFSVDMIRQTEKESPEEQVNLAIKIRGQEISK